MNPVWIITGKEVRDSLRNRWVLAAALLLAALALSLGFLGSSPTGSVKVDPLTVTVVSLSSLSIFLIPLIAMLLSYDALIGEIERGTMALLLSYPISRNQILAGNYRPPHHPCPCYHGRLRIGRYYPSACQRRF